MVTTDVTQTTTLPSACKGLSSYAIALLTQAWANAEIFPKMLFLDDLEPVKELPSEPATADLELSLSA